MTSLKQMSFSGGELAPSLYARVDQIKYATGLRTLRNFFIMRHGGAANRPGTTFICEVKDSTKQVRLIPFVFNSDQTYVLEFGNEYMRVIRAGAQVTLTAHNITAITNANPCVMTYSGVDDLANGDEVYISNISGDIGAYLNNRNFLVANINTGANTFSIQYLDGTNVNSTSFGSYTSGGSIAEIYEISTPYLEADLSEIQITQSADVVTIVHPSYAPRKLSRTGHTSWTLTTMTFAPTTTAPGSVTNGGAAGTATEWVVTTVAEETFEESLQSSSTGSSATPSSGSPITVSWGSVSGAYLYNVYKKINGIYGYIGSSGTTSFIDVGISADPNDTPPSSRNPFGSSDNYPSCVAYIQQRLALGNTNTKPETIYLSRTGLTENFTSSTPTQDDDAVTFTLAGRQVNEVRHLVDIGKLVCFTANGEWTVEGDSAGIIRPGEVNPRQNSYNGSNTLAPLIIGGNALYVQARGTIVRDLGFDWQVDKYQGSDLTIFSAHMFDGYSLEDWAYQQIPHSIVWAVRDDGTLLGLTYVREHQVWGWHRHDFDGIVERVCSVPEGSEDALYLVIKRTIDGDTKRYIERLETRQVGDIKDCLFMDCALTFDGRNSDDSHTVTMSGGTNWTYDETIDLTTNNAFFAGTDVGNAIHIIGSDGTLIRFTITNYTNASAVTGRPHKTVPVNMRNAAISNWARAVDEVSGLWHLEGQDVSILGDGFVVASPNNDAYAVRTVTNGAVTLDKPYSVVHVGLPYISDLETLDIDTTQSETLADKKKNAGKLTAHVESSRGLWAGSQPPTDDDDDPLENLTELKIRNNESHDEPIALKTDTVDVTIQSQWNSNGRVFLRQIDPLPLTILSVIPSGYFPFRG